MINSIHTGYIWTPMMDNLSEHGGVLEGRKGTGYAVPDLPGRRDGGYRLWRGLPRHG